jgi:hypothetical protein
MSVNTQGWRSKSGSSAVLNDPSAWRHAAPGFFIGLAAFGLFVACDKSTAKDTAKASEPLKKRRPGGVTRFRGLGDGLLTVVMLAGSALDGIIR